MIAAVLAVGYSGWPLLQDQPLRQTLAVFAALMCVLHAATLYRQSCTHSGHGTLTRLASGHWRLTGLQGSVDGSLVRAWHGWGWVTLSIRPFDGSSARAVTLWRCHATDAAWHRLRVQTHWELAMLNEAHP